MSDKPIIKIDIDSEAFDAFQEKFAAYQAEVKATPDAWKETNGQVQELRSAFDDVQKSFDAVVKSTTSSKFAGDSGIVHKLETTSKKVAESWLSIGKSVDKTQRGITDIARASISFAASGGKLLGGAAVAAGTAAFAGVDKAVNSFAEQNETNKELGLAPGQQQAFDINYKKFGLGDDLLRKASEAKGDRTLAVRLGAVGISQDQVDNLDPVKLSELIARNIGSGFNDHRGMEKPWLDSLGLSQFVSYGQAKNLASQPQSAFDDAESNVDKDTPRLAQQQAELDRATEEKVKLDAALKEAETAVESAFLKLAPTITDLTGNFADAVKAFSQSGELDKDIKGLTEAVKDAWEFIKPIVKYLEDKGPEMPKVGAASDPLDKAATDFTKRLVTGWAGSYKKIRHYLKYGDDLVHPGEEADDKGIVPNPPFNAIADKNRAANQAKAEAANGLKKGDLNGLMGVESRFGKDLIGPELKDGTHAEGAYQFTKATQKQYGVKNPFDEAEETAAAGRKLNDLIRKYGGDRQKAFAAYNWGDGYLDKDIAKNGDKWREHLPSETSDFLTKLTKNGVDLSVSDVLASKLGKANAPDSKDATTNSTTSTQRASANLGRMAPIVFDIRTTNSPGTDTSVSINSLNR